MVKPASSVIHGLILGARESKKVEEEEVRSKDRGYRLKCFDMQPFLGFREVHVVIQSHCPLHAFEYGEKQKRSLGFMLADWANTLIAYYYTQPISATKKEVYLEFQLDGQGGNRTSALWYATEAGREKLWFWVQAGHAFNLMKKELDTRLPSAPIVLTSNVDAPIDGATTTRSSNEKVRYVKNRRSRGVARILRLKGGTIVEKFER